jgi:peptide/nickel transport system ATP-binding protein
MTVLGLDAVTVHIGRTRILDGVSFAMDAGERVGLIGESGAGKSLTALAVLGLLPATASSSGAIELCGRPIADLSERKLAGLRGSRVAMVFQEPMTALDPLMRAGRQVAEVVRRHQSIGRKAAYDKAIELLAQVELPEPTAIARRYPHQLSGGQRQRVVLAMALANGPDVLICDEPTTALDVTVQAKMLALISRLVDEHDMALLFISHDLAVVSRVCERVLVMYGGRIAESGPVAAIFESPRHPYTAGLLAASDIADVTPGSVLQTIPGTVPGAGEFPSGCVFRDRCTRELPDCAAVPPLVSDGPDRLLACINPVEAS